MNANDTINSFAHRHRCSRFNQQQMIEALVLELEGLKGLNKTDGYEEPKEYWYIDCYGEVIRSLYNGNEWDERRKLIGNYFKTKEEAEKAVEKLKAWERLKDKGFEFCCDITYESLCGNGFNIPLNAIMPSKAYTDVEVSKDLGICFGGEE